MGVQGLWAVLEPCGRRINIEALRGKRLAVDASGWLFKFIKVMRNDQGELIPEAHLIGFFRRICRLLFHQIKPVFVFDGSTPALKRQTVRDRRKRREQQEARVRKTAEKFLLTKLKQHALNLATAPVNALPNTDSGPSTSAPASGPSVSAAAGDGAGPSTSQPPQHNEDQGPSVAEFEAALAVQDDDGDFDLDLLLPEGGTSVDASVLATLPPSIQLDVIAKLRENQAMLVRGELEGRAAKPEAFSLFQMQQYLKTTALRHKLDILRGAQAAANGVGNSRRIAAEFGREYVLDTIEEDAPAAVPIAPLAPEVDPLAPVHQQEVPVLNISFNMPIEAKSDTSDEWEDIDDEDEDDMGYEGGAGSSGQHQTTRRDFWTLSHGFKMGRKLGQWGEETGASNEETPIFQESETDRDLQMAIAASLNDMSATRQQGDATGARHVLEGIPDVQVETGHRGPSNHFLPNTQPQQQQQQQQEEIEIEIEIEVQEGVPALEIIDMTMAASHEVHDAEVHLVQPSATSKPSPSPDNQAQMPPLPALPSVEAARQIPSTTNVPVKHGVDGSPARQVQRTVVSAVPVDLMEDTRHDVEPSKQQGYMDKGAEVVEKKIQQQQQIDAPQDNNDGSVDEDDWIDVDDEDEVVVVKEQRQGGEEMVVIQPDEVAPRGDEQAPDPTTIPLSSLAPSPSIQPAAAAAAAASLPPQVHIPEERHAPQGPLNPVAPPQTTGPSTSAAAAVDADYLFQDLDPRQLQREEQQLRAERRVLLGQSDTPTEEMYVECQELLQLFGIPFIIAPTEAEAQCAWLDAHDLVDGVVTDDNDAFLFGARRVYRNIFEGKRYVEEYRTADVENELGLDSNTLINMALLLGSDYTAGVSGVGVVNALEIVRAFPGLNGLARFGSWVEDIDEAVMDLAFKANKSQRGKKSDANDAQDTQEQGQEEGGENGAIEEAFKRSHVGVRRSWVLPRGFPNAEVVAGYTEAKVDESTQKFTFGRPDLDLLRDFCYQRFGWGRDKADELLLPMIKAFDERQAQTTLDSFLSYRQRFAKIKSKRLQKAVAGITGKDDHGEIMYDEKDGGKKEIKGRKKQKQTKKDTPPTQATEEEEADAEQEEVIVIDDDDDDDDPPKKRRRRSKKAK